MILVILHISIIYNIYTISYGDLIIVKPPLSYGYCAILFGPAIVISFFNNPFLTFLPITLGFNIRVGDYVNIFYIHGCLNI